jgi:predicted nucleotidyltransferase component of viral defense system
MFRVNNPWFAGEASVPTFSRAEILATKLRALLQRNKGRDLFDLSHALDVFDGLDRNRIIECFGQYLRRSQTPIFSSLIALIPGERWAGTDETARRFGIAI